MNYKFVNTIPAMVDENILYISVEYCTAIHRCFCGCGNEVVTPISPTDWKITFDGETVSLNPSIGNWNLKCKSHYWIKNNQIVWAESWSENKIKEVRKLEYSEKVKYYNDKKPIKKKQARVQKEKILPNLWRKIKNWFVTQ